MNPDLQKKIDIAKKAGYSDDEINSYLKSKGLISSTPAPGTVDVSRGFTDPELERARLTGSSPAVSRPDLAASLLHPFTRTGKNILTAGITYPQMAASSLISGVNPELGAKVANADILGTQTRVAEIARGGNDLLTNPAMGDQLRASGEIVSYAVPGLLGKLGAARNIPRLTTPFVQGAGAGAVYGASQKDASGGTILTDALLGGAAAHILSKLPGVGRSIEDAGLKNKGIVLNPASSKKVTFALDRKEIIRQAQKLGLNGNPEQMGEQLGGKYLQIIDELNTAVANTKPNFNVKTMVKQAVDKAKRSVPESSSIFKENIQFWGDKLKNVKSVAELKDLHFQLEGELSNAFKALWKGNPIQKKDKILMDFWGVVHESLQNSSSEVKSTLEKLSITQQLKVGLEAQSGKMFTSKSLMGIPIPRNPLLGGLDKLGRAEQLVGKGVDSLIGGLPIDVATQVGARTPQLLQSFFGNKPVNTKVTNIDEFNKKVNEIADRVPDTSRVEEGSNIITREKLEQVLLSPNIKESTKKNVERVYKLQSGGLDAIEKKKVAEAQDALNLVDLIEQNYQELYQMGLTAQEPGLLERAGGFIKGKAASVSGNAAALAYDNTLKAFSRKLARAGGEKGVLTDADIKDFVSSLPNFSTPPEAAQRQFAYMRSVITGTIDDYLASQKEDLGGL